MSKRRIQVGKADLNHIADDSRWIPLSPSYRIVSHTGTLSIPEDLLRKAQNAASVLSHLDLIYFFSRFPPRFHIPLCPVDMAFCICNLCRGASVDPNGISWGNSYHVSFQILLLLQLEALEIFQNTCAGILDILLRDLQCLLELQAISDTMLLDHMGHRTCTKLSCIFPI